MLLIAYNLTAPLTKQIIHTTNRVQSLPLAFNFYIVEKLKEVNPIPPIKQYLVINRVSVKKTPNCIIATNCNNLVLNTLMNCSSSLMNTHLC